MICHIVDASTPLQLQKSFNKKYSTSRREPYLIQGLTYRNEDGDQRFCILIILEEDE